MKTLFLAWQATRPAHSKGVASRLWFPIGRLDAIPEQKLFRFSYTQGAEKARDEADFSPLDAFPRLNGSYESSELFPLFQNRLLNPKRDDYAELLRRLAIDAHEVDPLDVLAVSEGRRQTDHLEVFPKILTRRDGGFVCRFFVHGWRHVSEAARERLLRMRSGESLRIALELNNPATGNAIQLQSADDYQVLGWAPRYLVADLGRAFSHEPTAIEASVIRLNLEPAPYNQRLLVQLTGRFPEKFAPMSGNEYEPIAIDSSRLN